PRPSLAVGAPFDVVGRNAVLVVDARDPSGLRSLTITIGQGGAEQVVVDETYDPPRAQVRREWRPAKETRFKLKEGPGTVRIDARSASWGSFFRGKPSRLEKAFTARLVPPRLEVVSSQHYVNQGGCDMVVYRVTPPGVESGVVAGKARFKGFPLPGASDPSLH